MQAPPTPKISVCIPTFNSESYLARTLESVLAQTFSDFELIIIDDCSNDSTINISTEYAGQDARIIVQNSSDHIGLFRNYNRCMSTARGQYIKLLAHDDLLAPEALATMAEILDAHDDVSVVGCTRTLIGSNNELLGTASAFPYGGKILGSTAITEALTKLDNHIGDPSCMMFRTDLVGGGFSDNYLYLNLEFWCRLFIKGSYFHVQQPLCSQRQHDKQRGNTLLQSLIYVADYLQLLEDGAEMAARCGMDVENWQQRLKQVMIDHVNFRLAQEGFTAAVCSDSARAVIAHADSRYAEILAAKYGLLTHWSFREIANTLSETHRLRSEIAAKDDEIAWLKSQIAKR